MFSNISRRRLSRLPPLICKISTLRNQGSQWNRRLLVALTIGASATASAFLAPSLGVVYADIDDNSRRISRDRAAESVETQPTSSDAFLTAIMQHAQSVRPSPLGLGRVDIMTLATNNPIEDYNSIGTNYFSSTLGFHLCGIYDGHVGTATAYILSEVLPLAVASYLADLYSRHAATSDSIGIDISGGHAYQAYERNPGEPPDPVPANEEIDDAIRSAFCDVDELIVHDTAQKVLGLDDAAYRAIRGAEGFQKTGIFDANVRDTDSASILRSAVTTLAPALAGSCALMGIFNSADRSLRVAATGDSRAVWGRRVPSASDPNSYTYEVQELTLDQNARNPAEAARLAALHPDEPELLKNNRILGWGPTRAFGDGAMKWSIEVQKRLHEDFLGDRPREVCKTPPYFTAEPVITTKEGIQRGDFVVYASDGLWDCLESEEVVGLVGLWLEEYGIKERVPISEFGDDLREVIRAPPIPIFGSEAELMESQSLSTTKLTPPQLPVVYHSEYKDRTMMYKYWRKNKDFVCKDMNVAVHLVRNALGGANTDLREALLAMRGPRARRFRDDITVMVVFYD